VGIEEAGIGSTLADFYFNAFATAGTGAAVLLALFVDVGASVNVAALVVDAEEFSELSQNNTSFDLR